VTLPHAWRDPVKIRACRPKPATDALALIPDSKVGQLAHLVRTSGALDLIDDEVDRRPGPPGLPVHVVLTGLLLALHYHDTARLSDACRILLDEISDTAKHWLGIEGVDSTDPHARIAFCKRVYRSFDRLTTALDPERVDRRRRLPLEEATVHAAAWEDADPEHVRRRTVLQQVSDAFVLSPVRTAISHGLMRGWPGDVGVDTTGVKAWHHPPSDRRRLGSVETTAGWHFSAGATEGVFGHSLTLPVAASRRSSGGKRVSRHPQLALGAVLDTGGKRPGPNAVHTLTTLAELGLPTGVLAADRAYTDQTTEHFQTHVRRLGYQLALDYKQEHRGIQGTHHGALLIDGSLACPLTPHRAATATTGLDDKQIREIEADTELQARIAARAPFHLRLKQNPDHTGTIRLQCPAAGPSPSITCPRFNRLHPPTRSGPSTVDLTDLRAVASHPAAKPATQITAAERLRPPPPSQLPRICRTPTITIRPGDLGKLDKFRQDRHYLSPEWHDAFKAIRANNEGTNGRAKGFRVDLADPKRRLAHGRAAQTILVALMLCTLNLQILHDWRHSNATSSPFEATADEEPPGPGPADRARRPGPSHRRAPKPAAREPGDHGRPRRHGAQSSLAGPSTHPGPGTEQDFACPRRQCAGTLLTAPGGAAGQRTAMDRWVSSCPPPRRWSTCVIPHTALRRCPTTAADPSAADPVRGAGRDGRPDCLIRRAGGMEYRAVAHRRSTACCPNGMPTAREGGLLRARSSARLTASRPIPAGSNGV
jgi:hypothetical protein